MMSGFFFWGEEEGSKMTPKNRTLEGKNGPKNQTSFMDVPLPICLSSQDIPEDSKNEMKFFLRQHT